MRYSEIIETKTAPTIASATGAGGQINRKTADRIIDPRGYFHAKWPTSGKARKGRKQK